MKLKFTYLIIFTFAFVGLKAQNFVYPEGQHQIHLVEDENYASYNIAIETPEVEAIQYKWELVQNTCPSAWNYSLCDLGGCYVGIPPSGSMSPITEDQANNGQSGFFKINLTVGKNYGHGMIQLYVYDANDYDRGDVVSWDITWSPVGLEVKELAEVNLYPNPATDFIVVKAEEAYSLSIYNLAGSVEKQLNITKGATRIDVKDLSAGVYVLQLSSDDAVLTKKIIIE